MSLWMCDGCEAVREFDDAKVDAIIDKFREDIHDPELRKLVDDQLCGCPNHFGWMLIGSQAHLDYLMGMHPAQLVFDMVSRAYTDYVLEANGIDPTTTTDEGRNK